MAGELERPRQVRGDGGFTCPALLIQHGDHLHAHLLNTSFTQMSNFSEKQRNPATARVCRKLYVEK
jgi:hypothetical protein